MLVLRVGLLLQLHSRDQDDKADSASTGKFNFCFATLLLGTLGVARSVAPSPLRVRIHSKRPLEALCKRRAFVAARQISYLEALKQVVDDDGVTGLFVRGLQTRILVNALQVTFEIPQGSFVFNGSPSRGYS